MVLSFAHGGWAGPESVHAYETFFFPILLILNMGGSVQTSYVSILGEKIVLGTRVTLSRIGFFLFPLRVTISGLGVAFYQVL